MLQVQEAGKLPNNGRDVTDSEVSLDMLAWLKEQQQQLEEQRMNS